MILPAMGGQAYARSVSFTLNISKTSVRTSVSFSLFFTSIIVSRCPFYASQANEMNHHHSSSSKTTSAAAHKRSSSSQPSKQMGCAQTKPSSMDSPPYSNKSGGSLDKLKQQNGYVATNHPRRSTSQKSDPDRPPLGQKRDGNRSGGGGGGKAAAAGNRSGGSGGVSGGGSSSVGDDVFGLNGEGEEMVDGWPKWLVNNIPRDALKGLLPKSADSYDKIDKIGQGTYSNVYKARDRETGKLVALKKVRFDTSEPESIKFMAREIMILRELDHPNIVKLLGLATSRMQFSLYLVFDFMVSDLHRVISRPDTTLTEPQIKCYMKQLLSGLNHIHDKGILHRDIKGSNLLIDKSGTLKIADFGLANYYSEPKRDSLKPLTNRVVTLWYRAPELLLGSTDYGIGIDLWSAGCLLAEMYAGRPILAGRTEVEQIHKIFKLCGSPSEEYWKKMKFPTTFRPRQTYKSSIVELFRELPDSSIGLLSSLLALDPFYRGSAASALDHQFFHVNPMACDVSDLPVMYKEEDEVEETNEQRRRRRSKARRKARAKREMKNNSESEIEIPAIENQQMKEEEEEPTQNDNSSNSSAVNPTTTPQQDQSPAKLESPDQPNYKMLSAGSKNLPPLPGDLLTKSPTSTSNIYYTAEEQMHRFHQISRSASTRDFRRPNPKMHLERYPFED